MRGLTSMAMSIGAVIASGITTYLSFFDERYTLTATVAEVAGQIQTSSFSSGDGPLEVTYRVFLSPTVILSNRGTRPLVATDATLIRSQSLEECAPGEETTSPFTPIQALILEPSAVTDLTFEFGVPPMTNDFDARQDLWCLRFVLIDHRGERFEPMIEAVRVDFTQTPVIEDGEAKAPELSADIDFPRRPVTLAGLGWLSSF